MTPEGVHVDLRAIGKSFGAIRALHDVSIAVKAGSVHAFVGENGAGKSTLGKIIGGVFPPDDGEMAVNGEVVTFGSPREALERGIALVAQEVAVVPARTVAENVFLGTEPRRFGFVRGRLLLERFSRLVDEAGFHLPANVVVGTLPIAKQQQVEILRALAREAELIVFDEPTAALSAEEAERFHQIVRRLTGGGRTVVLVSHLLGEVLALADTITVLRDGQVVRTGPAAEETEETLVSAMLGRSVGRTYPVKAVPPTGAPAALVVRDLVAPGVDGVSLEIRAGEIVALAGLVGAGRSELARAIYGAVPTTATELSSRGATLSRSPVGSIRAGIAMIPESRKDEGLLLRRPVRENVSISKLSALSRLGVVRRRAEAKRVRETLHGAAATSSLDAIPATLSGGNQQKLLFARALLADPSVLIADEPTRGVDVGAKRDLYELLVAMAGRGVAVLLISNEVEEILGLAHRALVMRAGRIVAELAGDQLTEAAILAASFGRVRSAA